MFQEVKAAVEVATTHTDTMALVVEGNDWRDNEIDCLRRNERPGNRFKQAEIVSFQFRVWRELSKNHVAARIGYRRENALFCAPCAMDDFGRVNFVG
jgi:L-fucose isomerase-like protein